MKVTRQHNESFSSVHLCIPMPFLITHMLHIHPSPPLRCSISLTS